MVEPAIAITAMNIATLRPMFKNTFHFASKRLDGSVDDDETLRPSGESELNMQHMKGTRNSVSAKEYSAEFAEMLGLSRVGVTTRISSGGSEPEKKQIRRRFQLWKPATIKEDVENESQTELNAVPSTPTLPDQSQWGSGIRATTVITYEK